MATRKTWYVELSGGLATTYTVLGANPFEAASRGWKLDLAHQSHAERVSLLVQVGGAFEDVEDDIPVSSEDVLKAKVQALDTRLKAVEAKVP
jgi:hypothetical protein